MIRDSDSALSVYKWFIVSVLLVCFGYFTNSCRQSLKALDKKDALTSLKVLNSDLMSMIDSSSTRPEMQALRFLSEQISSPLPFHQDTSKTGPNRITYVFDSHKGIYNWDTTFNAFIKTKDTSVILIHFPLLSSSNSICKLILYDYQEQKARSRGDFPTKAVAKLWIDNAEILNIIHFAKISEDLLSEIKTEISTNDYSFKLNLSRNGTFAEQKGKIMGEISLIAGFHTILNTQFDIDIDYHPPVTYSFETIRIKNKLFNSYLGGTVNYGDISPTAEYYAEEFNRNTQLELIDTDQKALIGKIVLAPVTKVDELDYFVEFADGTQSRLSDNILVLKKLFNLKY